MEFLIVRHSETNKNHEDKFDLLSDTHDRFTEFGVFQLEATRQFLIHEKSNKRTIILTGIRKRVKDTAIHLSKNLNIPYDLIHDFLPIYPGTLSGLTQEEARKVYPNLMNDRKLFSKNQIDGYKIRFPKGDNLKGYEQKIKRIILGELKTHNKFDKIILIAHRSTILALLNIFSKEFGIQESNTYKYYETPIGCIDKINFDNDKFNSGKIERLGGYFAWLHNLPVNNKRN